MDQETFEQLVSESLDQPERDDLRAAIEAAVVQSPAWSHLRDQWLRLDRLLRDAYPRVAGIDWSRLQRRISQRLGPSDAGLEVDEKIRGLTTIEQRVDWPRLHKRISQAVSDEVARPAALRFPLRRVATGLALLAAAAAPVLMLRPPAEMSTAPSGFAHVRVSSPAVALQSRAQAHGYARVTVSAPPDAEQSLADRQPSRSDAARPQPGEVFLMVEPVRVAARIHGSLTPLGFN